MPAHPPSHLARKENQVRLIAVFLFTVVLALTFQFYKHNAPSTAATLKPLSRPLDESLFLGLRHASPPEIRAVLPEAAGKPMLLEFASRFCHDCQRMAPVLSQVMPQHPQVLFKKVDVLDEQNKYPALFRTFKPVSVPMLVFINRRGEIRNVLYNYQKPTAVVAALNELEQAP